MTENTLFGWDSYEENPNDGVLLKTISTQKDGTYLQLSETKQNLNALETYLNSTGDTVNVQFTEVIGEEAEALVFNKGFVPEGTIIPGDYEKPSTPSDIPTENTETVKLALVGDAVANAMTTNNYYQDIIVENANITENVQFNATDKVVMDSITVTGSKGSSNGKVTYSAPEVTIQNVEMGPDQETTLYNMFEGNQNTSKPGLDNMTVRNMTINNPNLTHNVVNVYTPADNAHILFKDCSFSLTVDNSNVLRLANYANASNVTVEFENVEWTYENGLSSNDWGWAGLVIYQPASSDNALNGDYTELSTWKFSFKNCKYNGVKVNDVNFGEHNQVMYMYNLNNTGNVTDPRDIEGLDITFA